jgi:hypothetical protein
MPILKRGNNNNKFDDDDDNDIDITNNMII